MSRRVIAIVLISLLAGASSRPSPLSVSKEAANGFLTEAFAPRPASNLEPLCRTPHRMWGSAAKHAGLLEPRTTHRPSSPSPFDFAVREAKHQDGRQSHDSKSKKPPVYDLGKNGGLIRRLLNGNLSRLQKLLNLNETQIRSIETKRDSYGPYVSLKNFQARHHPVFVKTFFDNAVEWLQELSSEKDPIVAFLNEKTTNSQKLIQAGLTPTQAQSVIDDHDETGAYLGRRDVYARFHKLAADVVIHRLEQWLIPFLSRHPSLTPAETREQLRKEFLAYTGIVHYPCALLDIHSLIDLARFFPKARIIASDGFVPYEVPKSVDLPDKGDPTAVMTFLRQGFTKSLFVQSVHLRPIPRAKLTFHITIQFSDMALAQYPALPRELQLDYKVGLFHDLAQPAGVLYLHQPGSAGGLLFEPAFWSDVISTMELPGWVLTADSGENTHDWHMNPPFETPWMKRVYTPTEDPEPLSMALGARIFVWQMRLPSAAKPYSPAHRKLAQNA